MIMKQRSMKLPVSSYNWLSIIGATIALISLFMIIFLFVISVIFNQRSSYLGLIVYIALPTILILGLILIPIGMIIKHNKDRKIHEENPRQWPLIDFNDPTHRNAFMIFSVGSAIFLLLSAVGSYEAFHFSESVTFCGTLCHTVMKPEYTAYQNSPHAKVACVDCHVGPGADWFVKSKLSGLYQVYAVTFNAYPKPIPVPIHNLRPARETCEECHWPEKFYARQLVVQKHYLADQINTEWDINLEMKTGPTISALGLQEGIHWHINPDVKIEYAATTPDRTIIPWVRYTNKKTGESHVFMDKDNPLSQKQLDSLEIRVMDCMDCHNRPSHNYQTPVFFVNNAMTAGLIPKELPDAKYEAMDALNNNFTTTDSALQYIKSHVTDYYSTLYPDLVKTNPALIDKEIMGIQGEFRKNIFPEMKVKWNVYPNNIGHLEFMGCFRCHNDKHTSDQGVVISKDCNLCHTIIAQGTPGSMQVSNVFEALEFNHPNDPNQAWKHKFCVECHKDLYQ